MAPAPLLPTLGINGLKLHGSTLYFTNSAEKLLAKIETNPDGTAAGKAIIIARSPTGATFDDFALDWRGDAFLAIGPGNLIEEVGRDGEPRVIYCWYREFDGDWEPTSAQFGRTVADREVLYVTPGGGLAAPIDGDEIVGGQLVAVDTDGLWRA